MSSNKDRKMILSYRGKPHTFEASSGHPRLCRFCNAGKDETRRNGGFIHHL